MANADYIRIGFWEEPTDGPIDREAIIASYQSIVTELKEAFPSAIVFGGIPDMLARSDDGTEV